MDDGLDNPPEDGCPRCRDVVQRPDVPHLFKKCEACGRELRFVRPGKHAIGIRAEDGEKFVIPAGWLTASLHPLKGNAHLTPHGIDLFARQLFFGSPPRDADGYEDHMESLSQELERVLRSSPLLEGLDLDSENDAPEVLERVRRDPGCPEHWALFAGTLYGVAATAREDGDPVAASWATSMAERARGLFLFSEQLRDAVWMGHQARRVVDVLTTWSTNRDNADEGFWQATLSDHSYALSQVFAVPVVFIKEGAYVGGMKIDGKEAKFVDFLLSAESSREAILVEIKTPKTPLLGKRYRGAFAPSSELSGGIVQVLGYRDELVKSLTPLTRPDDPPLDPFRPRCVLIAGDGEIQLDTAERRRSFERFRESVDVELVTYDELFRKVEVLANLFGLRRAT